MGGGVAMRVAGKIAGFVNGSFRGGFPALPENISSAAFKANSTRPITGVVSSSDTQIDAASSSMTKPLNPSKDWELAEEVASNRDVGQPLPRLVFGGAPTLEEAKDATFQLRTALDQAYLSSESSEGSYVSDTGNDNLAVPDSAHSAPKRALQAFRMLRENAATQTVVASIVTDPNVWTAVMNNEELLEFLKSQNSGMNGSLEESTADTKIPCYQFPKYSDDEMGSEKEPKIGFNSFFKDIKSRLEDMMNSLSGFIPSLFAGPAAADGSDKVDHTMSASIMGLVVMVIMVVVFKRV